jgi:DNA polymerase-3 subunit epsilon
MHQWSNQMSFEELGRPLHEITFLVVDLETTGGSAAKGAMITEIGAVKVRGGEVLGEFQTLVNPGTAIPAFISGLTGITDEMVATSPRIHAVLPAFLEFAHGCVLVAHNAPFDIGFLRHFAGADWPDFEVVDTVRLARQVLARGETPNLKLSTLAALFRTQTTPDHRALSDARATVDVLHGLISRVGSQGINTLEELKLVNSKVTPAIRRKRRLAEHLPESPGVYLFKDDADHVLYVGTSNNLRRRVRSYFTSSEKRSRILQMVTIATRVDYVTCATDLEARVRELRLISAQAPPYNRRGRRQHKLHWLKITNEAWPRLSLVRSVLDDGADYFGPFTSRGATQECLDAIHETFRIRQCTDRFAKTPRRSPCILAEMGRCLSPCDSSTDGEQYSLEVERVRIALGRSPSAVIEQLNRQMAKLAAEDRFEEAALQRDRLSTFVRLTARSQRLKALAGCAELVAANRNAQGVWEVHVIRHGRLVGAGAIPANANAGVFIDQLCLSSESVEPIADAALAATPEESELILDWLDQPGVRMVRATGQWACPIEGAGKWSATYDAINESRHLVASF